MHFCVYGFESHILQLFCCCKLSEFLLFKIAHFLCTENMYYFLITQSMTYHICRNKTIQQSSKIENGLILLFIKKHFSFFFSFGHFLWIRYMQLCTVELNITILNHQNIGRLAEWSKALCLVRSPALGVRVRISYLTAFISQIIRTYYILFVHKNAELRFFMYEKCCSLF